MAPGPDVISRFYTYRRVLDLPLFAVVGFSVSEVLMPWLNKLEVVGSLTLLLCLASVVLSRALGRELQRRHRAERSLQSFNQELKARVVREVAAREEAQGRLLASQRRRRSASSQGAWPTMSTTSCRRDHERLTGMIMQAADRGAAVTRRLLVFARQGDPRADVVDATARMRGDIRPGAAAGRAGSRQGGRHRRLTRRTVRARRRP